MIRIGTRKSKLALWQAETVKASLEKLHFSPVLVPMSSQGDLIQDKPLHVIGGSGLFTKVLDHALLHHEIDLAVHSLKDYPTQVPEGLVLAAVLPRANSHDVLVYNGSAAFFEQEEALGVIATGSPRRKAQWLHKYPNYTVVGLRGNVPTRLQKLEASNNQGAIFAKAGLERLDMLPENHIVLDWMVPAPAQGVIGLVCREEDRELRETLKLISHADTFLTAHIERQFLNRAEGGCSAPIGVHATLSGTDIKLRACISSLDGKDQISLEETFPKNEAKDAGLRYADLALSQGGKEIIEKIKQAEGFGV